MKKIYFPLFVIVFIIITGHVFAQKAIKYGSNNGKYVSLLNTKIYYEEYGKGIPLLLLHGGMGSIADFSKCIPELSKHFRVIAADAPGNAKSAMSDTMTYDLLASYTLEMINKLKLDSAYLMGWSDGGNAALIAASKNPGKIKKILVSGSNYKLSGYKFSDTNELKPIPPDHIASKDEQKWVDEYFEFNKSQWIKILNDRIKMWASEIYFPKEVLEKITIPVIIMIGDRDAVTIEHATEMHGLVKGSQFCILPNTSHSVFSERPKLVNEIAIDFFKK